MFDLINNAICIAFAVLAFPVGPLFIAWGSGPHAGERGERVW